MDSTDISTTNTPHMLDENSNTPVTTTTTTTSTLDIDPTTFKSTLPPRKRAKTQEEKEQRKIERILRNRRAAHASREKKRKHVEYLENYVLKLEENLNKLNTNYNTVINLLPTDQQQSIKDTLQILDDVSELKEKIHSNLNGSRKSNKKSTNKDSDEDDCEDVNSKEDEEFIEDEPVSKKRKIDSSVNTTSISTPSSTTTLSSSLSPTNTNTTTTTTTSPNLSPLKVKKEFLSVDEVQQQQQHQQPEQDVYNIKNELEDAFWNYPSPISFHDSPLQLDLETNSTSGSFSSSSSSSSSSNTSSFPSLSSSNPSTNHSIADLAVISHASRANRIISVGF
ncbi:hypothetical protein G210_1715 [Candida maltosa Xu316]|uniref:BZIP domain-containing protein n=1 Tax=Candida maltosa (strain Xu316) TaxID=1245528 RepID=M3IN60_CANMX|nr:hypothetical protein G210_1715 [Candida maltosa Xu316]